MDDTDAYFYFAHFLSAYLHQDYIEVSGSLDGAVEDYLAQEPAYLSLGLRADVERFLAEHATAPRAAFDRTFPGAFHIGDDDDTARAWLTHILDRLAARIG